MAAEFVTQAQTHREIRETRPQAVFCIILTIQIQFRTGLQDESLCQQQLVLGFGGERGSTVVAHIGSHIHLEPVGRQALYTECQPLTVLAFVKLVESNTELGVEKGVKCMPPQQVG